VSINIKSVIPIRQNVKLECAHGSSITPCCGGALPAEASFILAFFRTLCERRSLKLLQFQKVMSACLTLVGFGLANQR